METQEFSKRSPLSGSRLRLPVKRNGHYVFPFPKPVSTSIEFGFLSIFDLSGEIISRKLNFSAVVDMSAGHCIKADMAKIASDFSAAFSNTSHDDFFLLDQKSFLHGQRTKSSCSRKRGGK